MPRWFLLALIFSASIMESHGVVAAQPPLEEPREVPSAPAAARLRFRRVYAPADRVQDWPRGTTRYVPVEGEDFERLLRAAQELGETSPPAAALTRADYTAQLDDRGTLHGSLAWDVERSGLTPAPLPMAPLSLALKALRWSDSPEPVDLGLADDGANILVAARSGTLTGNWSLRSRRDSDGQLVFRFELPRAALSTVLLTVAPGVVPTASSGLLSLVEHQDGRHVYRWLLGAAEETTLRIPIPAMPAARQPAILMRETTVYNISTRGLDVATTWKLDVPATPVRKLELSLDGGLQLVAARLGETEVPHTSSAGERPDQTRVVLDMPDALTGSDRPLRLSAIGALTPGAVQSLPRIHAESCTWQEGVCTVLIHEPFAVRQLLTHDCRQTKYSLLPEPNRGESFEFQLFSDRSAIDLTVARDSSVAKLSSLTHMSLGEDDAHATIQVVAQALHGRPTLFRADVESDWIIDAVESDTPGELSDWRFETGERIPTLALRLAHPLTTETSLALTIRAHRPAAAEANGNWSAADLQVLHFRDVDLEDRLLTLEAEPGRAIALTGAHSLAGVDPAVLADLSAGLVRASEGRPLYRLGPHDSAFDVRVVNEAPHFSGKIVSTLRVDHQSVVELHAIRCQPADEALTEVKVRFGHKSSSPPSFRLKGEGQAALVARLIEEPDVKHADGETWKVTFTQPLQGACELTIDRTTPFRDEFDVNFATLPDADLLQAQVIIEAAADVGLSIHDSGIAAASLGSEPLAPTTRALYEYTGEEVHARITIRQDETALVPRAAGTAWHRRIESSYDVAGRALHFATWQLRAGGRESVTLTMPTDCTARRIWLNGRLLEHRDEQAIAISLPSDEVTVTLSVEYEAQGPALTNGIDLEPPVISIDWPVVSSDWLLWLPPGFEVQDVGGGRCEQVTPAGSWSQRWFGPLGRATAQDPFDVPRGLARFSVGGKIEQASAAAYFAHLADQARRLPNLASADWGSLFATNSDGATTLTVDAAALAELQIGPRSMIESRGLLPDSRALGDVLENAGLVLLESPAGMLLTSSLTAQLHRAEVQWIEPRRLGILRNGPLLDLLTRDSPDEKRFPTAAAWAQHGWQPTAAEAQLDRMPRFGGSAT
ncbi:MAG: hypothetical protein ABUL64_03940, partial [Singulisphaera sp.]